MSVSQSYLAARADEDSAEIVRLQRENAILRRQNQELRERNAELIAASDPDYDPFRDEPDDGDDDDSP